MEVTADAKAPTTSKAASSGKVRTDDENTKILLEEAVNKAPASLRPYLVPLVPYLLLVSNICSGIINFALPLLEKGWEKGNKLWVLVQPYHPEEFAPMLLGLLLMFFGGYFAMTIACVEAFRVSGWTQVSHGIETLWRQGKVVMNASKQDDIKDEDGDGIADVNQIEAKELATRKAKLILRVCNPQEVSEALSGLYTGCVGVVAALRMEFARTVALGATIGDLLKGPTTKYLVPAIKAFIPAAYQKWIPILVGYACKTIGISIAWMLQRLLSAFHSAMRGATMFTDAFAKYTTRMGHGHLHEGPFDEIFAGVCMVIGFYLQVTSLFTLPWVLKIILFPFVFFESICVMIVSW